MSNRTLVELNHDYCPRDGEVESYGLALQRYMRSGNKEFLPAGVAFKNMRHHSEPEPAEPTSGEPPQSAEPSAPLDKARAMSAQEFFDLRFPEIETDEPFSGEQMISFAEEYARRLRSRPMPPEQIASDFEHGYERLKELRRRANRTMPQSSKEVMTTANVGRNSRTSPTLSATRATSEIDGVASPIPSEPPTQPSMPMEEWWRQQYLSLLEYTKSLSAAASPKPEGPPEPAAGEICKHCELEIFPDAAFDWTSFGDPTCAKNTDGHEPMHPVEQLSAMLDAGGMLNMLHHDPIADVDLSHDPDQRRKEAATPGPHTENQPAERPEGGEGPTYPTVIIKCEGDRCNLCRPELPARPPANLDKIAKRIVHKFVYTNRFDRSNVQQVKDYVAEQLRQLLASPVPSAAPTCPICKSTDLTIYEHSGEFFLHCSDNQTHPAWRVETAQDLAAFFSPQASATPQEEK